jgi:hypothetical protein
VRIAQTVSPSERVIPVRCRLCIPVPDFTPKVVLVRCSRITSPLVCQGEVNLPNFFATSQDSILICSDICGAKWLIWSHGRLFQSRFTVIAIFAGSTVFLAIHIVHIITLWCITIIFPRNISSSHIPHEVSQLIRLLCVPLCRTLFEPIPDSSMADNKAKARIVATNYI